MPSIPFRKSDGLRQRFSDHRLCPRSQRHLLLYAPHMRSPQRRRRRRRGVGVARQGCRLRVRLLNADGSEAEISGNGTRCVAAWYCAENHRSSVVIRTGAGLKTCELKGHDGNDFEFRSSMGAPEVGDEFPIKFTYGEITGTPVSMGNPHYVVFRPGIRAGLAGRGRADLQAPRLSSTE